MCGFIGRHISPFRGVGDVGERFTSPAAPAPIGTLLIPRNEMEVPTLPPSAPKRRPGVMVLRSDTDWTVLRSSAAEEKAVMATGTSRSEEHTSELQSLMRISYAVFCLKKKKKIQ